MITFNTDNMVAQEFPFPAPIMDYIYKNVTASQLLKLYKTCKFFYDKYRLYIIEDFEICFDKERERVVGNSLAICRENPALMELKNLWICKSFAYYKEESEEEEEALSLDHNNFSRMTYTTLVMSGVFPLEEYEFLVKPLTLRDAVVAGRILVSDNPDTGEVNLSFDECIEHLPHVSTIELSLTGIHFEGISTIDMSKLLLMERQTKLTSFHVFDAIDIPDPLLVVEFFTKNAHPYIVYHFGFDDGVEGNFEGFFKTIDDGLRDWKASLQLPPAISTSFLNLSGKTVVITGACDGIGKAATILFRQLGASVIAISRNRGQLKSLIDECKDIANTGFLHTMNNGICDEDDEEKLVQRLRFKFGAKLDILVNIADTWGWTIIPDNQLEKMFWRDMHTVLKSRYKIIRVATPFLKVAKGSVINVSVPHDLITKPKKAASIANRDRKIKIAELQLASSGVRINSVNSGTPPTALPRPSGMNKADYKKWLKDSMKTYEEQAANAVAYLASDSAKLIDGATLPVNTFNLQ